MKEKEVIKKKGGHGAAYVEQLGVTEPAIEKFVTKYLSPKL